MLAEKYTESLKLFSEIPAYDHDLGFLVFCSYGNGYRLTHNPTYRDVIIATADSLATLYNPKVGTILSWPRNIEMLGGHNTIMDNMINLEMLFWAARNGGDRRLFDVAVSHADKTMKNQFRPDYTSYHVAVYDTLTGNCIKKCTHQGYADESMWARGQAWAIYGYTVVFRETGDPKYLEFAEKLVDVYLRICQRTMYLTGILMHPIYRMHLRMLLQLVWLLLLYWRCLVFMETGKGKSTRKLLKKCCAV